MANQFKLGTLAIGGTPVTLPYGKSCLFDGRIPELRNTEPGKEISWVVVGGKLIASSCLLSSISYHDLDVLGLVGPTRAYIDGRAYTLRLLRVGAEEGAPNEWDSALLRYDKTPEKEALKYHALMLFMTYCREVIEVEQRVERPPTTKSMSCKGGAAR